MIETCLKNVATVPCPPSNTKIAAKHNYGVVFALAKINSEVFNVIIFNEY